MADSISSAHLLTSPPATHARPGLRHPLHQVRQLHIRRDRHRAAPTFPSQTARQLPQPLRRHVRRVRRHCSLSLVRTVRHPGRQQHSVHGGQTVAQVGSNPQQLQYIALCFGFSLAVNAWVFFRISGGLFNPAVTFGMCLIGALPWIRGGCCLWCRFWVGLRRRRSWRVCFRIRGRLM